MTLKFLTDNYSRVDDTGSHENKRWWPQDFDSRRVDFAAIDLRGVRMRQLALAYGLTHYLGHLEENGVLPLLGEDYNYIDDVTNLAGLRTHERLMEHHFEQGPAPYPKELNNAFLLEEGNKSSALHGELYTRATLGLWEITQDAPYRPRTIKIGRLGKTFHLEAYAPAVEKLKENHLLKLPKIDE